MVDMITEHKLLKRLDSEFGDVDFNVFYEEGLVKVNFAVKVNSELSGYEINEELLSFCKRKASRNELEYRCKFDNGDWDFQAMARFAVGKIGCSPEFEERIRKIHSAAFTDQHLIDRGLY